MPVHACRKTCVNHYVVVGLRRWCELRKRQRTEIEIDRESKPHTHTHTHVQGKFKSKGKQNNSNNNAGQGHLSRVACAPCAPAVIIKSHSCNNYKPRGKAEEAEEEAERKKPDEAIAKCVVPTSVVVLDRQRLNAARHTGAYNVLCVVLHFVPIRTHTHTHSSNTW